MNVTADNAYSIIPINNIKPMNQRLLKLVFDHKPIVIGAINTAAKKQTDQIRISWLNVLRLMLAKSWNMLNETLVGKTTAHNHAPYNRTHA